jgi:hypothetical protein
VVVCWLKIGIARVRTISVGGDVTGVDQPASASALGAVKVVPLSEGGNFASAAGEGSTECPIKITKKAEATEAPTRAAMARPTNFRIDGCAVDLSSPGLLSTVTEGGVWRGAKKLSLSPLIHLLISANDMMGEIPRLSDILSKREFGFEFCTVKKVRECHFRDTCCIVYAIPSIEVFIRGV